MIPVLSVIALFVVRGLPLLLGIAFIYLAATRGYAAGRRLLAERQAKQLEDENRRLKATVEELREDLSYDRKFR